MTEEEKISLFEDFLERFENDVADELPPVGDKDVSDEISIERQDGLKKVFSSINKNIMDIYDDEDDITFDISEDQKTIIKSFSKEFPKGLVEEFKSHLEFREIISTHFERENAKKRLKEIREENENNASDLSLSKASNNTIAASKTSVMKVAAGLGLIICIAAAGLYFIGDEIAENSTDVAGDFIDSTEFGLSGSKDSVQFGHEQDIDSQLLKEIDSLKLELKTVQTEDEKIIKLKIDSLLKLIEAQSEL